MFLGVESGVIVTATVEARHADKNTVGTVNGGKALRALLFVDLNKK
jgi:hypothetical protein